MRKVKHARAGEIALGVLAGAAVTYEFTFDDLLSMATERWCSKRPWLRFVILAAGSAITWHLACLAPSCVDIFDARNVLHQWIVRHLLREIDCDKTYLTVGRYRQPVAMG